MTITPLGDVASYNDGTTTLASAKGVYVVGTAGSAPSAFSSTKQEDVASADGDYGSASLWVRRDTNVVRTTLDGDYTNPAVDSYGNNKTTVTPTDLFNAGVTSFATTVAASGLVLKATPGNLYDYNVVTGASAGYLMIFNATAAPADGTVTPALCIPIAANAGIAFTFPVPRRFSIGCTMVFSTTGPFTKTASVTAFMAGGMM